MIRTMKEKEWGEVASLIHSATNTWYVQNGKPPVFSCSESDLKFFCEVYESLDPDCCLVAEEDGQIAACCFYHPRPTHFSLGIMCVHPNFYGRGLARRILQEVVSLSIKANKSLHLISSAQNIDSFSLYNKAGFVPNEVFQDMILQVPEEGISLNEKELQRVRPAKDSDVRKLVSLERSINGFDHSKDLEFIIANESGSWQCHIIENEHAKITGFLCSVNHACSKIIGLGAILKHEDTLTLIKSHLNNFKGFSPLLLIPAKEKELVQALLKMKAKNIEIHMTQSLGTAPATTTKGLFMPTFLPE
ncbi:MAG: GNAT family N-acetyltransferase [Lentisphaeraceae bacterium]|nr:GNAT family N-acetyltransferase [Lentisphaeraceae bacterium]